MLKHALQNMRPRCGHRSQSRADESTPQDAPPCCCSGSTDNESDCEEGGLELLADSTDPPEFCLMDSLMSGSSLEDRDRVIKSPFDETQAFMVLHQCTETENLLSNTFGDPEEPAHSNPQSPHSPQLVHQVFVFGQEHRAEHRRSCSLLYRDNHANVPISPTDACGQSFFENREHRQAGSRPANYRTEKIIPPRGVKG